MDSQLPPHPPSSPPDASAPDGSDPFATCPHGRRAGTTTCLYCRSEARAAARQQRNRILARVGLIAMGGVAVVALVVGAIISLVPSRPGAAVADSAAPGNVAFAAEDRPATPRFVLEPRIPEGRSALGDSVVAERAGGDVTVLFDTETLRTRFDWKFEGVVRATLPLVYGEPARVALDSVPSGALVRGDLLRDLPTRGIRLALTDSRVLTVYPVTRPGRDGPLVIGYRATAARN